LIESIPGVCEVDLHGPRNRPADLLIELPHGATREDHFDALRTKLVGDYPQDLKDFFFVNTDVGAPECAAEIARRLGAGGAAVLVVRCLIPRTFVDCNRLIDGTASAGEMTPGIPEFVRDAQDVRMLVQLHGSYQELTRRAYELICAPGGIALMLHTYAPRNVRIDKIDAGIARALHRAYEPQAYDRWERRPQVDLISEDADGRRLAPPAIMESLKREYAAIGIEVGENATYRLHQETMGYVHSVAYPGRVFCMEISRELLADPFAPFEEMCIGPHKVEHAVNPIISTLSSRAAAG
jgi:hypothetical protein